MNPVFTRWLGFFQIAAIVVFVIASPATSSSQPVPAVVHDSKVVWYASPGLRTQFAGALDQWAKLHPDVPIEIVEGAGPELTERVKTEARAHRPVADVLSLGDISAWPAAEEGTYQRYDAAAIPNLKDVLPRLRKFMDKDQRIIPGWLLMFGIAVNTHDVAQRDWPQRWSDVLRPGFSGKIGIHDFGVIGGGLVWYMIGAPVLGEAYYKNLVNVQKPRAFSRTQELQGAVISGERSVMVPAPYNLAILGKDAPVHWIAPKDGVFFLTYYHGIVRDAPHAAAAQMFLNFMLGAVAQSNAADAGFLPVVRTANAPLDISKLPFLGNGAVDPGQAIRINDSLKLGQKLMGE